MSSFNIEGKVALVTGGASGIGFQVIKQLLKNNIRGVVVADIEKNQNVESLSPGKVFFLKTDVTNKSQFEDAFKLAVEKFNQLDIVINNAGILDDVMYEKEIDVNCKGTAHGTMLAVDNYLKNYKQGKEGVIINISSIAGIAVLPHCPIYGGTKSFIVHFTRSLGTDHLYKKTGLKIMSVCPGATDTPIFDKLRVYNEDFQHFFEKSEDELPRQSAEFMASEIICVIKNGETGSCWFVNHAPAREIKETAL